jgi:DUF4097 and DUF4098 domain-containing protein YvlB
MRTRFLLTLVVFMAGAVLAAAQDDPMTAARSRAHAARELARAYQGRGAEQSERFSKRVKMGRDGRLTVSNVSGDITVTGGSGDEVSIEAIKRGRGPRDDLRDVEIDVDDRGGRVEVRTVYSGRNEHIAVDYTITVPGGAAVELNAVAGNLKVTDVKGSVRLTTVSGSISASGAPHVEAAKSVSGSVALNGIALDGDLNAGSVSGSVTLNGAKVRSMDLGSVSGNLVVTDASCERLTAKSVSGTVEYSGSLARNGRYDINSHSGGVRLTLPANTGFELTANTFSGSIRSDFAMTVGGDASREVRGPGPRKESIHGTVGDGSAVLTVRTFSGNIVITKK